MSDTKIELELPYPPSVNTYYRHVGARTLISAKGRQYRWSVCELLMVARARPVMAAQAEPMTGPLHIAIEIYPPDKRRRDIDNVLKALLDALEHAGAYEDDSQIVRLEIIKCDPIKGGKTIVRIEGARI